MELKKKPHQDCWEGQRCRMGWSHTYIWWIKIRRDSSGVRCPNSTPGRPAQGSSARKRSLRNFWLQKPVGIEAVEDRNFLSPRQFLLKGPCTDLLSLTPPKLPHEGSRLKGIRDYREELSSPASGQELGAAFSRQKCWQKPLFLFWALPPQSP